MVISFMPWVIAGAIIVAVLMGAGVLAFNTVVGTRILKKYPEQGGRSEHALDRR